MENNVNPGTDQGNDYEWTTLANGLISVPTADTIKRLISEKVTHTDKSRLEKSFFSIYIREITIPLIQIALIVVAFLVLLTWPTDYYYFSHDSKIIDAYFWWRTISLIGIATFLPLLEFSEYLRRNVFPVLFVAVLADIVLTGYLFGNIAELNLTKPWFYVIFVLPIITVFLSVKIVPRIIATFLVPIAYAGAYFFDNLEALVFLNQGYELRPYYMGYEYIGLIANITVSIVIISILLGHIVYHLNRSNFFQARALKKQQQKIQKLADQDQLTGLYTRREFENRFRKEYERCERYDSKISVMMIDLDHFKDVNDTYGHPVGDEVLQTMGSLIEEQTRMSDIAGRYGGEEFCLVLPETSKENTKAIAERLREALSDVEFQGPEGETFTVTCSIGIAEYEETHGDPEELLGNADQALYEAKEAGRDRVVVA
ncbi:MAG: GGDEF domain-containing protein [bacterium]